MALAPTRTLLEKNPIVRLRASKDEDLRVIEEFAEFWKIPWVSNWQDSPAALVFSSGELGEKPDATVLISPSGPENALEIARQNGLEFKLDTNRRVSIPFTRDISVSTFASIYNFAGSKLEPIISSGPVTILSKFVGENRYLSSVDMVGESSRLLRGIEDPPHMRFRLVSKIGAYTLVPKFLRNRAFRDKDGLQKLTLDRIAPLECLRVIFLASIVKALRRPVPIVGFWRRGKDHALAVTHDVETREGLLTGCPKLFDIEQKLGVSSTWNVPSNRYPLEKDSIAKLANAGELGGHDTKHDGKLVLVRQDERIKRLSECKNTLEKISGKRVEGFRSPLLQHSAQLVEAIGQAGFTHDSSLPSWEPLSPTSLQPHGIGTVFPLMIGKIVEIPVSLPQDHQLLRVIGLTPTESVDALHKFSDWIHGFGGCCVLLVHPDYEFAQPENKAEYQRLLAKYTSDSKCDIMTLQAMAEWWSLRSTARWSVEEGYLRLDGPDGTLPNMQPKLVNGFDEKIGFAMEDIP